MIAFIQLFKIFSGRNWKENWDWRVLCCDSRIVTTFRRVFMGIGIAIDSVLAIHVDCSHGNFPQNNSLKKYAYGTLILLRVHINFILIQRFRKRTKKQFYRIWNKKLFLRWNFLDGIFEIEIVLGDVSSRVYIVVNCLHTLSTNIHLYGHLYTKLPEQDAIYT